MFHCIEADMTKPFSLFRGKTGSQTMTFKKLMQTAYSGPRDHKQGEVEKGNHKYQLWDFIHRFVFVCKFISGHTSLIHTPSPGLSLLLPHYSFKL